MLANREGLFHAYPSAIGLDEQGSNKLACYTIAFEIFEEKNSSQWADVAGEKMEITGWFYLETRDGRTNDFTIDSLKAAFGWDGRDPFWLQDSADSLREHPVQIKLGWEEYNGSVNIKVQYLNPYGSTGGGGVSMADDSSRRNIANRLGSKLRAIAGGSPASVPKPSEKPSPSGNVSAPAAEKPDAPSPPAPATMDQAWSEFVESYNSSGPQEGGREDCEKQWFEILNQLFPGKQPDELSPADWAVVCSQGPGKIVPF